MSDPPTQFDDAPSQPRFTDMETGVAARLLTYLRRGGHAFDEDAVRDLIVLNYRFFSGTTELTNQFYGRHDELVGLADKVRETRDLIKRTLDIPQYGGDTLGAAHNLLRAMQTFHPGTPSSNDLYQLAQNLLSGMTVFEMIAREASNQSGRPNHRTKGSANLTCDEVRWLAQVFWEATGCNPDKCRGKRGEYLFTDFVKVYLSALGIKLNDKYLDEKLKEYLRDWVPPPRTMAKSPAEAGPPVRMSDGRGA